MVPFAKVVPLNWVCFAYSLLHFLLGCFKPGTLFEEPIAREYREEAILELVLAIDELILLFAKHALYTLRVSEIIIAVVSD